MPSIHLADSSNRINGVRSSLRHTDAAKRTESGKELTPISRSNRQPYPTITVTEAQQGNFKWSGYCANRRSEGMLPVRYRRFPPILRKSCGARFNLAWVRCNLGSLKLTSTRNKPRKPASQREPMEETANSVWLAKRRSVSAPTGGNGQNGL